MLANLRMPQFPPSSGAPRKTARARTQLMRSWAFVAFIGATATLLVSGAPLADKVVAWADSVRRGAGRVRQFVSRGVLLGAASEIRKLENDVKSFRAMIEERRRAKTTPPSSEEKPAATPPPSDYSTGLEQVLVNTTFTPKRCGRVAKPGHRLRLQFLGKLLKTDKMFASSFHTGSVPKKVILGDPDEIQGWAQGLRGMCEGERRSIMIPWRQAYGDKGDAGMGVPPRADLVFFVELVSVSERPARGFEHLVSSQEL